MKLPDSTPPHKTFRLSRHPSHNTLTYQKVGIKEAYDQWAASYDSDPNATRDLDRDVTEKIAGTGQYRSVLELGCGTGKNTRLFARISERVIAVDLSGEMLAVAAGKHIHGTVHFAAVDLLQPWPFVSGWADLISCNLVLEHIKELDPIFSRAYRTAAPGGRFFICELHPIRQYLGSQAQFTTAGSTQFIAAHVHHISDYLNSARRYGFHLLALDEWWHEKDHNKPPRLVSFMFEKSAPHEVE